MKEYLTLTSCKVDQTSGTVTVDNTNQFTLSINPLNFDNSETINYNEDQAPGQAGQVIRFSSIGAKELKFDIVLDGTGVVGGSSVDSVNTQVDSLKGVVSEYIGDKHRPNVVRIVWGSIIFYGSLRSMSIKNTLFKSSGDPLRAKVSLSFTEYKTSKEIIQEANMSSPDLTHIIEVVAGDTLPLLCNKVYNNCAYYLKVARINNLSNFRKLTPGMKLKFPPLR